MELIYIFRVLYRKKWIIILCTILAVVAAFALTMKQKKLFRSAAQLSTGFTVSQDIKLSEEIFNIPQIDVKFNNAIADITSAKVLHLLAYKLIIHDLTSPSPFRKLQPSDLEANPSLKNLDKAAVSKTFYTKMDSMLLLNPRSASDKKLLDILEAYKYDLKSIGKYLYVGRYQRTDYIDVVFRSENPELSAFVVNTVCKEFQRYNEVARRERSIESMIALDSLVKKRKQELDNKINAKARYLQDSVASSIDPSLLGVNSLGEISRYESMLLDERAKVQDYTYQISELTRRLNDLGQAPSNNPVVINNSGNTEYALLRRQYNDVFEEYSKKGFNDPALKKQLDDLLQRMNAAAPTNNSGSNLNGQDDQSFVSTQRSNLTQQKMFAEGMLRASNSKIASYSSKLNELRSRLNAASPGSAAMLEKFDKDIEIAQLEYTSAKEKFTIASNMNDAGLNNFKQTLFGQPSAEPEPSKRMMILGLSGLSAFILTSLIFIFIAYIDQSIKTPSQFARQTDLRLLGTVNLINMKQNSLADQVTQIEQEEAKRNNSFRELLRKLRYEIERSGKRVILFTSTEPQQGKTTLAQALAFSLSLGKKKVLLIDTNFCNNDLTVFNNAMPSLEQFHGNGQLNEEAVEKIITKTAVEDVDIIGCKGGDYTPTEILPKNHLLKYLPDLLKHYDFIFMEAAPLNGFTDTKELAPYADGVIAIFSATAEVKQADKESIKYLHDLKDKFIGAVLNKVVKADINN